MHEGPVRYAGVCADTCDLTVTAILRITDWWVAQSWLTGPSWPDQVLADRLHDCPNGTRACENAFVCDQTSCRSSRR